MRKPAFAAIAVMLVVACSTGGGQTTTTDAAPPDSTTTTTAAESTTTTEAEATEDAAVYFLHDSGGNPARTPPFLVAVHREVAADDALAARIEALLAGPTPDESEAGISSSVPEGTSLLGASVDGGIATVDLSSEFESGGGSLSVLSRLAQLVYTATAVEGVDGVVLELDGASVDTFSGEGVVLDGPQVREDYQDLLPGILVEDPAWGAPVTEPIEVSGIAAAFEGVFQLEIQDAEGNRLAGPPFVQAEGGMGWFPFSTSVELPDNAPQDLVIHVWEESAPDGSPVSERFQPVRLES